MTDERLVSPRDPGAWTPAEAFPDYVVRRLDGHDRQLRSLEDWRLEMRTAFRLLQLTFGTSVLAAVVGVMSLLANLPK